MRDGKAHMNIGKAPVTVAGRYRCEVRTEENEMLSGSSFVYRQFIAVTFFSEVYAVVYGKPNHQIILD